MNYFKIIVCLEYYLVTQKQRVIQILWNNHSECHYKFIYLNRDSGKNAEKAKTLSLEVANSKMMGKVKTLGKDIFPGTVCLYSSVSYRDNTWILKNIFAGLGDSNGCSSAYKCFTAP